MAGPPLPWPFVPVLYVNSVSSKDFPWALAFLLAAWWCAMRKRAWLTGILLGVAMGCRITSGAAALPIALILIDGAGNRLALRRVLTAGLIAGTIVLAAFLPVYDRYGADFFNFYAEHGFPGPIANRRPHDGGKSGAFSASPASASPSLPLHGPRAAPVLPRRQLLAWISMLVIYAIAFLCLPDEAAYLIPAVPFVILIAWWAAPPWAFRACCALIVASPFLTWSGARPAPGLIFQDHRERTMTDAQIEQFLRFSALATGSNAYIVGSWEPPIAVLTADTPHPNSKYLYLLPPGQLDQLISQGWRVWYLPLMREFNARVYSYDIATHGARDGPSDAD